MNLVEFAKYELLSQGLLDIGSDYDGMLGSSVLELIEVFATQGHSGFSAGLVSSLFDKLSRFQPLGPLTGKDDEWVEVADGLLQNRRCFRVFKENGIAYDSEGKIFRDKDGICYTNRDSRVNVEFPYIPKHEYVDVV